MTNDTPRECEPDAHCWHADTAQPAVFIMNGSMTAYTCCNCGKRKTETVRWVDPKPHGPFAR